MTELDPNALHPAEHRGYRELYVACRQLLGRWPKLGAALADTGCGPALDRGAVVVEGLLNEIEPRCAAYGLHLGPAAGSVAAGVGGVRSAVVDRALDAGPAARLAVLDIEHIATLLGQLGTVAESRGDDDLAEFCGGWRKKTRAEVKGVRKAVTKLGRDPDRLTEPLDSSPIGQFAHSAGLAFGTLGEWFDKRKADR